MDPAEAETVEILTKFWDGLSKLDGGVDRAGFCSSTAVCFRTAGLEELGGSLSFRRDLRSLWRGDVCGAYSL